LTTRHCVLSADNTKLHSFRLLFFWRFCPLDTYFQLPVTNHTNQITQTHGRWPGIEPRTFWLQGDHLTGQ